MEVIIAPAAGNDIRQAHAYYAERNPEAAARLVRSILDAISGLTLFPLIGRSGVVPGTRERILTRYPYKIVYEINGDKIEVDRVLHTSQRWPETTRE
jgi:plasmid stabilization system protein ParE